MGELDAHFAVSRLLGHERADVTNIYLASVKKGAHDGEYPKASFRSEVVVYWFVNRNKGKNKGNRYPLTCICNFSPQNPQKTKEKAPKSYDFDAFLWCAVQDSNL